MRLDERLRSRWRTRRAARSLGLPDPWTRADLISAASAMRGRPVVVTEGHADDAELCGAIISTDSSDTILLVAAPEWHQDAILAHEVAHIVLGHVQMGTVDPNLAQSISGMIPDIDLADVVSALGRTRYDTRDEIEAEWLATALFARSAPASQAREHVGAYHRSIRSALGGI